MRAPRTFLPEPGDLFGPFFEILDARKGVETDLGAVLFIFEAVTFRFGTAFEAFI